MRGALHCRRSASDENRVRIGGAIGGVVDVLQNGKRVFPAPVLSGEWERCRDDLV
jgi:hypothetical protein